VLSQPGERLSVSTPVRLNSTPLKKQAERKTHTLTIAEMPSHQHTSDAAATSVTGSAAHDSAGGGLNQRASGLTAIPLQGGGGAHNNLQPYIVTYMWKRTA